MTGSRTIVVTGASRGLGAAIARWLAASAVEVVLAARSERDLERTAARIREEGGKAIAVAGDLADPRHCRRLVDRALERGGRLDGLVNNAGTVDPLSPAADAAPDRWRQSLAVNLLAPVLLTAAALPALRQRQGRVINVSSGAAVRPIAGAAAYCAAKAALNQYTAVLAGEEPGVTAICVRPGVVDTAMQARLRAADPREMPADQVAFYRKLEAEGLLEPPEVPGRAIAWLALRAPRAFSGHFLDYDDPRFAGEAQRLPAPAGAHPG